MTPAEVEATEKQLRALASAWDNLPALVRAADALAAQAAEIEKMREALGMIAEGSAPPIPHGHYLAHRRAVDVARVALTVKAG